MYTLSISDTKHRGSIHIFNHETWDECFEHLRSFGEWKYLGCFGFGICEYELGGYVAHIYRR